MSSKRQRNGRKPTRRPEIKTGRNSGTIMSGYRRYPGPITIPNSNSFMVQFTNTSALLSNGSGVVAGTLQCDPSVTLSAPFSSQAQFSEWSSFAGLFTQVKCIQLEVRIYPSTTDEVKGDITAVLAFASNLSAIAAPSGYSSVADNGDSQTWPILIDTTGRGRYIAMRHRRSLEFANTASPFPTANLYQGCPGGIGFYGAGFPVSTNIGSLHYSGTYVLSMRT